MRRGKEPPSLQPLRQLFADKRICFVGRNIGTDASKLRECALEVARYLKIGAIAKIKGVNPNANPSLDRICALVLRRYLLKPAVRVSDAWLNELGPEALNYAALDAYVTYEIYKELHAKATIMSTVPLTPNRIRVGMEVQYVADLPGVGKDIVVALGKVVAAGTAGNNSPRVLGVNLNSYLAVVEVDEIKIAIAELPNRERFATARREPMGEIDPTKPGTFGEAFLFAGERQFQAVLPIRSLRLRG
jgi:hypothetical protein